MAAAAAAQVREEVHVEVEKIVEVERIVEVEKVVEKIVEVEKVVEVVPKKYVQGQEALEEYNQSILDQRDEVHTVLFSLVRS